MCRKITSHWQPLFSKKMAAAASFSYKIGGGGLIFQQNWQRRQGFGNITGVCSDIVWILDKSGRLLGSLPYNRVLRYRSVKPAQIRREGYTFHNLPL